MQPSEHSFRSTCPRPFIALHPLSLLYQHHFSPTLDMSAISELSSLQPTVDGVKSLHHKLNTYEENINTLYTHHRNQFNAADIAFLACGTRLQGPHLTASTSYELHPLFQNLRIQTLSARERDEYLHALGDLIADLVRLFSTYVSLFCEDPAIDHSSRLVTRSG